MATLLTRERARWTLALIALYGAIASLFSSYRYLDDLARNIHGTLLQRVLEEFTGAYTALVLIPLIIWVTHRFPPSKSRWLPTALAWFGGAVAYSVAHTTLMALTRTALFPALHLGSYDYGNMLYRYPMEASKDVIIYVTAAGFIYFLDRMAAARKAQVAAAELQTKLIKAQLENLQLQLQPHFLFNTLNAISAVMYEDVRKADAMISRLSDFLRVVLASSGVYSVSLDEELSVERMYLEIMRARLERSLVLEVNVDAAASDAVVPFMLLQPLLENSIHHGMRDEREGINIRIDVLRENGSTVVNVSDNGAGFAPADPARRGYGLKNVESRLQHLFGERSSFAISERAEGGAQVELRFPYTTETSLS
jgi:two-component system, LytTR family, sensor kinase